MSERQVLDAILGEAVCIVFGEYVDEHGLGEIAEIFAKGERIEIGDMVPSAAYAEILRRVPPAWEKAFEVNAAEHPAVRASCVEFVLALFLDTAALAVITLFRIFRIGRVLRIVKSASSLRVIFSTFFLSMP